MKISRPVLLAALATPLTACSGSQSVLEPSGPHADAIWRIGWIMFTGGALIFLLVIGLTVLTIILPQERRRWLAQQNVVIAGGIVFPVAVLSLLLGYGFFVTRGHVGAEEPTLRIEVIGEQWWWRVRYLDESGGVRFATANEIRVPAGEPVEFILKSADVIHSFWVPSLAGKLDMVPGKVNTYTFSADKPGVYRGQCAEYCGAQHALMAFYLVAMEPGSFDAWAAGQADPAWDRVAAELKYGRDLFIANGCGACHTVRGTPATGDLGPDLTHVGGRLSIGAGTLPTNIGTLAGWISSTQHVKPGVSMPSFGNLESRDLRAIAAYLESLE
ncbi:cytochrome c oxidase subunit II [Chelativorans intermedius]|uniref:Cytochrome aa3 subunit 2 n=1 Tax=Chelativorans intermedius TaxID=515947 RepID=A0ABV6DBV9_9HYPH|nr:cytochrome c oxidase subunit II [Chelativorans intermedius]MCT9000306.1 cytochrome c oxidase subunit II [Chelativorans intermedius]